MKVWGFISMLTKMTRKVMVGMVLATALSGGGAFAGRASKERAAAEAAAAIRPGSPAAARANRRVLPLTPANVAKVMPGAHPARVKSDISANRWKPSAAWMASTGKKYGRLLIVSDMHPSTGRDPLTNRLNPSEDFLPNEQELDFRSFVQGQWKESAKDGERRTLVLNGDNLEYMQTDRPGDGSKWAGAGDKYGPTNSATNIITKTRAIMKGHPILLQTYAQHMVEGHRILLAPGNHDRQLLHPSVMSAVRKGLRQAVANELLKKNPARANGRATRAQKNVAYREAKGIVDAQFEFEPYLGLIGDVAFRHGHQNDQMNNFSTPMGPYYHPTAKDAHMEGAAGDYVVKSIFNKVEKREPWGDNTSNKKAVLKAVIGAADGSVRRAVGAIRYILTREGVSQSKAGQAKLARQIQGDVRRWVREQGMVGKLNEIKPAGDPDYTEDDAVELFSSYESKASKAAYTNFRPGQGAISRLGTIIRKAPSLIRAPKKMEVEAQMSAVLFKAGVGTIATGHDHKYRVEGSLVEDTKAGTVRRSDVLDSATWTDKIPDTSRTTGMESASRRGVIEVRFDKQGSHASLMDFSETRGLRMANVLESEDEAKKARGGQGSSY